MHTQQELKFFDETGPVPSADYRNAYLSQDNPGCPYYGFIGNEKVINRLKRIDFDALGKYNHATNELNIALVGPAGCGKTELARRHNKVRGLPFVEISPKAVKTCHDVYEEIAKAAVQAGVGLVEMERHNNYILPPMDVFIDEVHALSNSVVQGLLKATEHNDGKLATEKGFTVDCRNVHWMIGTTERGKLFDAFDTRFMKLQLHMYNEDAVAQIVRSHQNWPMDVCKLVAHYSSRVPREALAFAREMQLEYNMSKSPWPQVAAKVASDNDVDEYGMSFQRLAILKILGNGPVAANRLPMLIGIKIEEMEKFTMPWLMEAGDGLVPYVSVGHRGYTITEAGLQELDKRGFPHKGELALAA